MKSRLVFSVFYLVWLMGVFLEAILDSFLAALIGLLAMVWAYLSTAWYLLQVLKDFIQKGWSILCDHFGF